MDAEVIGRKGEGTEVMARIHLQQEVEAGPDDVVEVVLSGPANAMLQERVTVEWSTRRGRCAEPPPTPVGVAPPSSGGDDSGEPALFLSPPYEGGAGAERRSGGFCRWSR